MPASGLRPQQVAEARAAYATGTVSMRTLARRYQTATGTMWKILTGFTYRKLPGAVPPPGHPRGERHPHAKLSDAQVGELRAAWAANPVWGQKTALAREYGVSQRSVAYYLSGERRKEHG